MSEARLERPVYHRPWSLTGLLDLLWLFLSVALTGWLLSILIEWSGMALGWWTEPGARHAEQLLENELFWLGRDFLSADASDRVLDWASESRTLAFRYSGHEALLGWLLAPPGLGALERVRDFLLRFGEYWLASAYITQLVGVRLAVTVLSLPAFLLAGVMGVIDGLVRRDLRRFGGGAESGFLYHHLKKFLRPMIWLPIVVYLASPWSLHPTLVFVPPALTLGFVLRQTVARFKKYL